MTDARLIAFAERVSALRAQHKADMQVLRDEIAQTGKHDVAAVMRLAAWMDKDETDRAEREALDEQYRFLAGVLPEPAELPENGQIATAAALYADGMTVRAVAKEMGVSTGRAHKLKVLAAAFTGVHRAVNVNVNTPVNTHGVCPDTGEIIESSGQPSAPAPTADAPPEPPSSPLDTSSTESVGSTEGRAASRALAGDGHPAAVETADLGVSPLATPLGREQAGIKPGPTDTQPEDTLEIPEFLRRKKVAA